LVLKCIFLDCDGVFSVGVGVALLSLAVVGCSFSGARAEDLVLKCIFLGCDGVFSVGGDVPPLSPVAVGCS